jgi:hypothetical protein
MRARRGLREEAVLTDSLKHGRTLSSKELGRIICSIKKSSNFWRIVELSRQPLPVVAEVLSSLIDKGYLRVDDGRVLFSKDLSGLDLQDTVDFDESRCRGCNGRGLDMDRYSDLLKRFREIAKARPSALREFDQGFVSEETTIARVALMHRWADIKGKEIVLIGDDDLLSIGLWLTGMPERIVVLEIDERLTSFIRDVTGGTVEVRGYDVRRPLPEDLVGAFDVFFTDPTESLEGFKVFALRGMLSLRGDGAGYFGLTRVEASLNKWYEIQGFLHQCGFVITDIIDEFNHYQDWDYYQDTRAYSIAPVKIEPIPYWYKSSQIRIERVIERDLDNSEVTGLIYFDEESSTV